MQHFVRITAIDNGHVQNRIAIASSSNTHLLKDDGSFSTGSSALMYFCEVIISYMRRICCCRTISAGCSIGHSLVVLQACTATAAASAAMSVLSSLIAARVRPMTHERNSHDILLLDFAVQWKRLKACPHCRRKVRLSPNSATVDVVSPFSATVALFCDSVDRA